MTDMEVRDAGLPGAIIAFAFAAAFLGLILYLFAWQFTPIPGSRPSSVFRIAVIALAGLAILFLYIRLCVAQTAVFSDQGVEIRRSWFFWRTTQRRAAAEVASVDVVPRQGGVFVTRTAYDVALTFSGGQRLVLTSSRDASASDATARAVRERLGQARR
jgi:hypothetical protein